MSPRWKGRCAKAKALADPMSNTVLQLQSSLIISDAQGLLCGCSVLLAVQEEQANLLRRACFGQPIPNAEKDMLWFQLGMEEAFFLCYSLKCLKIVGKGRCPKDDQELWQYMKSKKAAFPEFYKAYSHLRMKDLVVRSGLQYGGDFVAYRHHPTLVHSEYVVIVKSEGDGDANGRLREWSDIRSILRVCIGVVKTLLELTIDKNGHDAASPSCLESYAVKEWEISGWFPGKSREDTTVDVINEKQLLVQMGQEEICACGSCLNTTEAAKVERIVSSQVENVGSSQRRDKDFFMPRRMCDDHKWLAQDNNDDRDTYGSASNLQSRSCNSIAHWNDEMGMAEVIIKKGQIWRNTGVIRTGNKLYCSIYEVSFLVEKGALRLLDDSGTSISKEDVYMKISDQNNRWSWEEFQAYRQLKDLGYVVGQHGIPWSTMSVKSKSEFVSSQGCPNSDEVVDFESEDASSAIGLCNEMHRNEARPVFDVYPPHTNFKKSCPGDTCCVVCFTRSRPPSTADREALKRQCDRIPLKYCHVEYGSLGFFSFDEVEVPIDYYR